MKFTIEIYGNLETNDISDMWLLGAWKSKGMAALQDCNVHLSETFSFSQNPPKVKALLNYSSSTSCILISRPVAAANLIDNISYFCQEIIVSFRIKLTFVFTQA